MENCSSENFISNNLFSSDLILAHKVVTSTPTPRGKNISDKIIPRKIS